MKRIARTLSRALARPNLLAIVPIRPVPTPVVDAHDEHPERAALRPYCVGRGIDVGCGADKVTANCIGVDILKPGELGKHGVVANRKSTADVFATGDELTPFASGELDFVVAKHNLEHYVDLVKVLQEWKRVLKPGGHLAVVVPDERAGDTVFLDPTHKHCFTPDSLSRLIRLIGGFEIVECRTVVAQWSFLLAARKNE